MKHRSAVKRSAWVLLSLFAVLAMICYLNFPLGYNQSIYHYVGSLLKDGRVPYRDFVDRKGPVGLLTYGLAGVLFGSSDMAYRVFDLLVLSSIGFCLFALLRRMFADVVAFFGAVLWFGHVLLDGPGNTGDVTNLIVLGVMITALLVEKKSDSRVFVLGTIAAAIAWVKPAAILIVAPTLVYYVLIVDRNQQQHAKLKDIGLMASGFTLMSLLIIAYLYFTRSLRDFYEIFILDSFSHYVPTSQLNLQHNLTGLGGWLLSDPVFRIGGLFGLLFLKSNQHDLWPYRLLVMGGLLAVMIESRFFPYHFSPILPFLPLGLIIGIQRLTQREWSRFPFFSKQLTVTLAVCAIVLLAFAPLKLVAKDLRIIYQSNRTSPARAELFHLQDLNKWYRQRLGVLDILRPAVKADESLYILGSDTGIYLALDKRAHARHGNPAYVLYNFVENSPPHRKRWRLEILKFVRESQVDWLVVNRELFQHMDAEARSSIQKVLDEGYFLTDDLQSNLVYKLRSEDHKLSAKLLLKLDL
ncbi:hypothetical protein GWN28_12435 [candidate division KSB1 bacterium]|nr:hypothetical protein [candidate division KSB1 bacterium]NIW69737.1 hypothetical protein [candidate division KSB1 bacterium]